MKDDTLKKLSTVHNVAQFVSFSPAGDVRHVVLRKPSPFYEQRGLIESLFEQADEGAVRVRSFLPDVKSGQPFTKRPIKKVEDADILVTNLRRQGLYVIVNESIDIDDGGVSGVLHGPVIEFSP